MTNGGLSSQIRECKFLLAVSVTVLATVFGLMALPVLYLSTWGKITKGLYFRPSSDHLLEIIPLRIARIVSSTSYNEVARSVPSSSAADLSPDRAEGEAVAVRPLLNSQQLIATAKLQRRVAASAFHCPPSLLPPSLPPSLPTDRPRGRKAG